MSNPKIVIGDQVSKELCSIIETEISKSTSNPFIMGLSGGSLPKFLVAGIESMKVDWSKVKFFFCDERMVDFSSPDSTFKLYNDSLVDKVPGITKDSFITVQTQLTAEEAAKDYQDKIKAYAEKGFDMLLLGMGPDGHTCSLFPGHPLLDETELIVAPITDSPKPPPSRVTLTLPWINKSKVVIFVSTGEGKKVMIENVLKKKMMEFPSTRVNPTNGTLYWIVDKPAASNL